MAEWDWIKEWVFSVAAGRQNEEKVLRFDERGCYEASTVDSDGNVYPVCVISGSFKDALNQFCFNFRLSSIR